MIDDPEVLRFIADTEAAYVGAASATIADRRAAYDAMCAIFRAPRPAVPVEDLVEAGVPLRLYRGGAGRACLYLHGGGFVLGSLDSHDDICAEIAVRAGVTVVAVDYRLAPEHVHPAQLDDAEVGFRVAEREGEVVLVGDSAGATLAAGLALRLRRNGLSLPRGQVLIYPLLGDDTTAGSFVEHAEAPMLTTADLAAFRAARFGAAEPAGPLEEAFPLAAADLSGMPRTLVVTADVDPLRDDGFAYVAALQRAGGEARLVNATQLPHAFLRARHRSLRARDAFAEIVAAARKFSR